MHFNFPPFSLLKTLKYPKKLNKVLKSKLLFNRFLNERIPLYHQTNKKFHNILNSSIFINQNSSSTKKSLQNY